MLDLALHQGIDRNLDECALGWKVVGDGRRGNSCAAGDLSVR
jgi:hypothetical protein